MYLLDTNVISEFRRADSGKADPNLLQWGAAVPANNLYLSAVTILELEMGILRIKRRDEVQFSILNSWLTQKVLTGFEGRILSFDMPIARRCAQLHVPDPQSERDSMIAATALVHGMTLVTRNTKDFVRSGVMLLNPWNA